MPLLRWQIYRFAEEMQLIGGAMLVILFALIAYQLTVQLPKIENLNSERSVLEKKFAVLQKQSEKQSMSMTTGNVMAQKFLIFETLKQHGLTVLDSTYRREEVVKGKFSRWTLQISLSGRYSDLVQGLRAVTLLPTAFQSLVNIEGLTLERQRIEETKLTIKLRLSVLGDEK